MSIKTWQERFESMSHPGGWLADATQRSQCKEDEIDELRGALHERDAEIETLKAEVDLYRSACDRRDAAITAQRKVLEQALEALQWFNYDEQWQSANRPHWFIEAITAIQGVLKS